MLVIWSRHARRVHEALTWRACSSAKAHPSRQKRTFVRHPCRSGRDLKGPAEGLYADPQAFGGVVDLVEPLIPALK